MSKGYVTYQPEGRLGNALFQAAAAMAYAWDYGMEFSMPTPAMSRSPDKWAPVYCQHLCKPDFDPERADVVVKEKGYAFQELPFNPKWEHCNIILQGFFQSERYWAHHRERVINELGFLPDSFPFTACHVRRGDALKYPEKHIILPAEWYDRQMANFHGSRFVFFSDDITWCKERFGHRKDCFFEAPFMDARSNWAHLSASVDLRPELWDMIAASWCENLIGSASTFAVWIGLLQNPNARRIFPKQWLVEGWEGTTANTWRDIMPREWERA